MKQKLVAVAVLSAVCLVALVAQSQTPVSDPTIGTWKLNVAKSKYSPGPPPFSSDIRRFEPHASGFTILSIWRISSQGVPTFQQSAYKLDGKDYPLYNQTTLAEFLATGKQQPGTTSVKLTAPDTAVAVTKANNVPGLPIVRTLSADKKTMTQTQKGKNAQGVTVDNVEVYEKVQ
jgi:hypothetical protein